MKKNCQIIEKKIDENQNLEAIIREVIMGINKFKVKDAKINKLMKIDRQDKQNRIESKALQISAILYFDSLIFSRSVNTAFSLEFCIIKFR